MLCWSCYEKLVGPVAAPAPTRAFLGQLKAKRPVKKFNASHLDANADPVRRVDDEEDSTLVPLDGEEDAQGHAQTATSAT